MFVASPHHDPLTPLCSPVCDPIHIFLNVAGMYPVSCFRFQTTSCALEEQKWRSNFNFVQKATYKCRLSVQSSNI